MTEEELQRIEHGDPSSFDWPVLGLVLGVVALLAYIMMEIL